MFDIRETRTALLAALAAVGVAFGSTVALADAGHDDSSTDNDDDNHGKGVARLLMPIMSSDAGMETFIEKGCYTCHAVNGLGGHDASPLDAHNMDEVMNPFELAAKMWRMAPIMIPLQEETLGEQIDFDGEELANIIAFLHDDEQQHKFTEELLSQEHMAAMNHEHGGMPSTEMHGEEIGHAD